MAGLSVLRCASCGASVPLPVDLAPGAALACGHCRSSVPLPAEYASAILAAARTAEARRAVEPIWKQLASPVAGWASTLGILLIVVLPPIATVVAMLIPAPPLGRVQVYALATVPAILPGAILTAWGAAVDATIVRVRDALCAQPPATKGAPPRCRQCAAPLALHPGELAATCAYCGSDNLIDEVPVRALQRRMREALRTLGDATRKLRSRRILLALGTIAVAIAVVGGAVLLWLATAA